MVHLGAVSRALGSRKKKARRCNAPGRLDRSFGLCPLQVRGGELAALAHDIVADLLALDQTRHPGTLDRGDVDKHIIAAINRLDEPEPFGHIEELDSTRGHL